MIDARYPLRETSDPDYAQRTEWNVRDSDGTLIITRGGMTGGTELTARFAREMGKPAYVFDLDVESDAVPAIRDWISANEIRVLNVAGPRASQCESIANDARRALRLVLQTR